MERVDWGARNKSWSVQWGHSLDPKSVKVVTQTAEERLEKVESQVPLPFGLDSHVIIREEIRKEMKIVKRIQEAIKNDTLDKLELELDAEDIKNAVEVTKKKIKSEAKLDLVFIQTQKDQEERILEQLADEESTAVETCKRCNHPKFVDGQVGIHHCS